MLTKKMVLIVFPLVLFLSSLGFGESADETLETWPKDAAVPPAYNLDSPSASESLNFEQDGAPVIGIPDDQREGWFKNQAPVSANPEPTTGIQAGDSQERVSGEPEKQVREEGVLNEIPGNEIPPAVIENNPVISPPQGNVPEVPQKITPPAPPISVSSSSIPQNVEECFPELASMMSPEDIETFKNKNDSKLDVYDSLTTWIKGHWVAPSGSPLRSYFNDRGVYNADEISKLILVSFHHHLNNKAIPLQEEINKLRNEPQDSVTKESNDDKGSKSAGKRNKKNRNQ